MGKVAPPPPPVEAGLASWELPVPISRSLVLPGPGRDLVVIGGETLPGSAANGAFVLNTDSGALRLTASLLLAGAYNASGAVLGHRDVVFGGATPTVSHTVEAFPAPAPASARAVAVTAADIGSLPQPRAGSVAVTIGRTAYIVGGYNGTSNDPDVLATTDGRIFRTVARLPVPVRYPAVAALGTVIFVFGDGDIQRVDPLTGLAAVVGHLPEPLKGASAVDLGGSIYVAGGQGPTRASATIWGLEPSTGKMIVAGHLQSAVSNAGVAVLGSTAWLVGGESGGHPVGAVQSFKPLAKEKAVSRPAAPRATGSSQLRAGRRTSPVRPVQAQSSRRQAPRQPS